MGINNTAENYGTIAKFFHWTTAVLFLGSYAAVYYRHWFTVKETPENWIALQLHLSVGVTVAVVIALRVLWKLRQRTPDPEPRYSIGTTGRSCGAFTFVCDHDRYACHRLYRYRCAYRVFLFV